MRNYVKKIYKSLCDIFWGFLQKCMCQEEMSMYNDKTGYAFIYNIGNTTVVGLL